jgi:hypothetical protein
MEDFDHVMKMRNFVKDTNGWTRKFTFVKFEDGKWEIGHSIGGRIGLLTEFKYEDMDEWIQYFDRI